MFRDHHRQPHLTRHCYHYPRSRSAAQLRHSSFPQARPWRSLLLVDHEGGSENLIYLFIYLFISTFDKENVKNATSVERMGALLISHLGAPHHTTRCYPTGYLIISRAVHLCQGKLPGHIIVQRFCAEIIDDDK